MTQFASNVWWWTDLCQRMVWVIGGIAPLFSPWACSWGLLFSLSVANESIWFHQNQMFQVLLITSVIKVTSVSDAFWQNENRCGRRWNAPLNISKGESPPCGEGPHWLLQWCRIVDYNHVTIWKKNKFVTTQYASLSPLDYTYFLGGVATEVILHHFIY